MSLHRNLRSILTGQHVSLKVFAPAEGATTVCAKHHHQALNGDVAEAVLANCDKGELAQNI